MSTSRESHQSLLLAMSQFSFSVICTHTECTIIHKKGLILKMQACYIDVVHAHQDIETVRTALKGGQSRMDTSHTLVCEHRH